MRTARRATVTAVVAALLAMLLAGCFFTPPPSFTPSPSPTGLAHPALLRPIAPITRPEILAYCPAVDAIHFDRLPIEADFVYICRGDGHHSSDGVSTYGPWQQAFLVTDPAAILAAYAAPDAPLAEHPCPAIAGDPLIIWVHRGGVATAYYAPVDECGQPQAAAAAIYEQIARHVVADVDAGTLGDGAGGDVPG